MFVLNKVLLFHGCIHLHDIYSGSDVAADTLQPESIKLARRGVGRPAKEPECEDNGKGDRDGNVETAKLGGREGEETGQAVGMLTEMEMSVGPSGQLSLSGPKVLIWGPGIKSKVLEPSVEPH